MAAFVAIAGLVALAVRCRPRATRATPPPRLARRQFSGRRARERGVNRALPDAIDLIVLAVRAGQLPAAAIATVLPHLDSELQQAFADVVAQVKGGVRFSDALVELPRRLGPRASPLADSLIAADRYGLPLAPVLDRLADEARQHRRRLIDSTARQLPVRLSLPLVLCTLPSFVLLAVVPLLLAAFASLNQ